MANPVPALVPAIAAALQELADPAQAARMQAYLRGHFTFLGIPTPLRRATVAALDTGPHSQEDMLGITRALWDVPFRECQYAAIDLLARHRKILDLSAVAPLLELAQRKPWWETVDGLASVIGFVVRQARAADAHAQASMDRALSHSSLWVRRIAMTHQLGWRLNTDQERLFAYARTLAPEQEFFIRKAIGWALRDYAKWNADAVVSFVRRHQHELAPLTVREALKHHLHLLDASN